MGAVMAGGVRRLCGVPVPMLEGRRQHWVGALSPSMKTVVDGRQSSGCTRTEIELGNKRESSYPNIVACARRTAINSMGSK